MMHMSAQGRDYLKGLEGLRLVSYLDTAGVWTIGYGHTGDDVGAGMRCNEREANQFFDRDLLFTEMEVSGMVRVPMAQYEFDALCCFAYNVGVNALRLSTLLRKLNEDDRPGAAAEFIRWNKETKTINGVKKLVINNGLTQRRAAERAIFEGRKPRIVGNPVPTPIPPETHHEQPPSQNSKLRKVQDHVVQRRPRRSNPV